MDDPYEIGGRRGDRGDRGRGARGARGQTRGRQQQGPVSRPRLNAQQRGELILQGFDAIPRFRYSDLIGITRDLFATSEELVTRNNNVPYVPAAGRGRGAAAGAIQRNTNILNRTNFAIRQRNNLSTLLPGPAVAPTPERDVPDAAAMPALAAVPPANVIAAPPFAQQPSLNAGVPPTAAQAQILVEKGILDPTQVNTNDTDNDANNRKADREIFYNQIKNILSYGVGELKDAGSNADITTFLANKSDEAITLYRREKATPAVPIPQADLIRFKTLSDNFEAGADNLERIAKAIFATSDTDDYADSYDFYTNIERLYEQKFEITSLIEEAKAAISVKLPKAGGALEDLDQAQAAARQEKIDEKQEEYNLKLEKLQQESLRIDRTIADWNGRLARPIVSAVDRKKADEELAKLFTESEKNISGFQTVLDEINSSRTGNWFDFVKTKSDNYVDIAGILFQTKKERIEAEKKQKEATAKFLNASANQRAIDDCLRNMKNVSTAKCDRITQIREIYRRAKEIEEAKNKLVQNAALMLNPSRGVLKYNDSLSDGQRMKLFEDLEKDMTRTYEQWVGLTIGDGALNPPRTGKYPIDPPPPFYTAPPGGTPQQITQYENNVKEFKREYDIFFNTYLTKVVSSSASYGESSLPGNAKLNELTASNEQYRRFKNPQIPPAAAAPVITDEDLYEIHFRTNTKKAIQLIDEQRNLIKLAKGGGDLVRQEIDSQKKAIDVRTESLMADYEKVKSLPTGIEKSEESTRKCFNEGFDKSKRERDDLLRQELAKFKADYDTELVSVEKEYKENLIKAKNEVREVQEAPRRKDPKDMTADELEKEYSQLLSSVQQLDDRIKQNRPEDSRRIQEFQGRLSNLRVKLAEVGRLRKPAGGYRHSTRRQAMY
jgi:hypothetical protein